MNDDASSYTVHWTVPPVKLFLLELFKSSFLSFLCPLTFSMTLGTGSYLIVSSDTWSIISSLSCHGVCVLKALLGFALCFFPCVEYNIYYIFRDVNPFFENYYNFFQKE